MLEALQQQIRSDCRVSLDATPGLAAGLAGHRIAVIGGTGFVGTWIAETVALLNDEYGARVRLDLLGRSAAKWGERHSHLGGRGDITPHVADVRSSFELASDVTLVLFAAGIADPAAWASEPQRVFETSVVGVSNALAAGRRLENLQRFVNISSGLVSNATPSVQGLKETDIGVLDFTRFHNLYAEARRAAESLACGFAGQYRIPLSTARAFTFVGPHQGLNAPWAVNNFMRDALNGHEIRVYGDGNPRRSYLYGSDAAAWLLQISLAGTDGGIYNVGGSEPVSHAQAAEMVANLAAPAVKVSFNGSPKDEGRSHDFFADLSHSRKSLNVDVTLDFATAVRRTMVWLAHSTGTAQRVNALA